MLEMGAAVAMHSPGAHHTTPHLALQAFRVAGCCGLVRTALWQAGLQPQAQQIPQQRCMGLLGEGAGLGIGGFCSQPGTS